MCISVRRWWLALGVCVVAVVALPGLALGQGYIHLGAADDMAIDQPRVSFGLYQNTTWVGPVVGNVGLLDTGANGVLLAAGAYQEDWFGGAANGFVQESGASGPVSYLEQGVAGASSLSVYQPYRLEVAGTSGLQPYINNVRAFGDPGLDIGSFSAIVGMPAMRGRVVNMNLQAMTSTSGDLGAYGDLFALLADMGLGDFSGLGLGVGSIDVSFRSDMPTSNGHSYTVNLAMLPPEFTGLQHPDDPKPTYAPLPILNEVRTSAGNAQHTGPMLLDTGAQTSIISKTVADALGIDYSPQGARVVGTVDVGGVGGTVSMPLVLLDRITLPTADSQGRTVDLVYSNVVVGVLDIPGIDGVFGMNMLTSGYLNAVLDSLGLGSNPFTINDVLNDPEFLTQLEEAGLLDPSLSNTELNAVLAQLLAPGANEPMFHNIVLDFRNVTETGGMGVMRFDLNPALDQVIVPEPATWMLVSLAGVWTLCRRRGVRQGGKSAIMSA